MNRQTFLGLLSFIFVVYPAKWSKKSAMQPETIYVKDDGKIPNSKFPVLIYRNVFTERNTSGAEWLEKRFAENNWTNSWRNGIYSFHHYHSTSHEVLGIYSGNARLHIGGERGPKINVQAGDILVLPAGVGHKNLDSSQLGVVGAYPDGRSWDLNRGLAGERPEVDQTIAALPVPTTDPILGATNGLPQIWQI